MGFKPGLPQFKVKKAAIDWGSYAVKIVSGVRRNGCYEIDALARVPVGDDFPLQLRKIWEDRNFSWSNVILCLNGPDTLVRVVEFPRMDKKTIRESLGYELAHYTPFSRDEVYYDFAVLDESGGNFKLLIALARKEFVDTRLVRLEEAGIVPAGLTLSPIVLTNACGRFMTGSSDAPVGILDLGYSSSMITVVQNGQIVLSREVKRGAKEIFTRMRNAIDLEISSFRELEENRNKISQHTLQNVCADLIEEVKVTLDFIESKDNTRVDRMYITEGLHSCAGLKDIFASSFGISVEPFDVTASFGGNEEIKKEMAASHGDFSIAVSALLD